jgi:hypothetical protein
MSTVREQIEVPGPTAGAARPPHTTDARAASPTRLLALQRTAGNRAVTRLLQRSNGHPPYGPVNDLDARLADARRVAQNLRDAANDLIDKAGRPWPTNPIETRRALEELANRGNQTAADLLRELRAAEGVENRLNLEALRRRLPFEPGGGGKGGAAGKEAAAKAGEKEAAKEAAGAGEKTVAKEAEKTVVKEAAGAAEKTVVKKAAKEAGEAAGERAAKRSLFRRVAAKVGVELLDGLVPDPLDALELMVDFAKSFTEAREAIRRSNLESGFAVGWAAYLVVPRWGWAKWFAHRVASRDVATQVVGAVGVAENAFNEGLVRGFIYGEKHSTSQSDRVRQKAFDAVLKSTGHTPGRYDGDDVYTFGRDDVYSFAGALHAAAVEVLKEADKRREARLEDERLKKHQKDLQKRFDAGRTWPR